VKTYDILNQALGIGWTTTNHTGNFVPLYAVGCGASLFTHNLNNTEIPMLILKAAGLNR
jgi:alkaline phosphatase